MTIVLVRTCFIKCLEWNLCQGENPFCLQTIKHIPSTLHRIVSQSDLLQIAQIFFLHVHNIILNFSISSECFIIAGDNPYLVIINQISFYVLIGQFRTKSFGVCWYGLLKRFQTFLSVQNILFRRGTSPIFLSIVACHLLLLHKVGLL